MSKEEKSNVNIGGIILLLLFIIIAIFAVSFALVNGVGNSSKNLDEAISKIHTEFANKNILETQSVDVSLHFDNPDKYKTAFGYNLPFTDKKYSFDYKITIRAGIKDLSALNISKSEDEKKIIVTLPEMEILNEDSDVGTISNEKENSSPFNKIQPGEKEQIKKDLKEKAMKQSIDEGILVRAKNHSVELLRNMISEIIGSDYEVEIK